MAEGRPGRHNKPPAQSQSAGTVCKQELLASMATLCKSKAGNRVVVLCGAPAGPCDAVSLPVLPMLFPAAGGALRCLF